MPVNNMRYFLSLNSFLFILILFGSSVSGAQPLIDQPFIDGGGIRPGESIEYNVRIKGIPAGTQVLKVNQKMVLNGKEVYHVESLSKTNSVFSVFYTFDDRSQSFINSKDFSPVHYERTILDGKYKGNLAIDFDLIKNVAKVEKNKKSTEVQVPRGTQDELSMIYLLRTKELEVGEEYEFNTLVGNRSTKVEVSVMRTEQLRTVLGTLKTIVVRTVPRDITVWFTHDSARIPVKMEANTKIGKLVANIKSIK